jgi:hypothetical protein
VRSAENVGHFGADWGIGAIDDWVIESLLIEGGGSSDECVEFVGHFGADWGICSLRLDGLRVSIVGIIGWDAG